MSTFAILWGFIPEQVLAGLGTALGLILVDVVLGILVSITQKTFDPRKLPSFLQSSILPYVGSLMILALASWIPAMQALFFAATAAVSVKFLADIKDKIVQMTGAKTDNTEEKTVQSTDSNSKAYIVSKITYTAAQEAAAIKTGDRSSGDEPASIT